MIAITPSTNDDGLDLTFYCFEGQSGYCFPADRILEYCRLIKYQPNCWIQTMGPLLRKGEQANFWAEFIDWHERGKIPLLDAKRPPSVYHCYRFPPTQQRASMIKLLEDMGGKPLPSLEADSEENALSALDKLFSNANFNSEWFAECLEGMRLARLRQWPRVSRLLVDDLLERVNRPNVILMDCLPMIWDPKVFVKDLLVFAGKEKTSHFIKRFVAGPQLANMALTANICWLEALSLVYTAQEILALANLSLEAAKSITLLLHLLPYVKSYNKSNLICKRTIAFVKWAWLAIEVVYADNTIAQRKLTTYLMTNVVTGRYSGDLFQHDYEDQWLLAGVLRYTHVHISGSQKILELAFA